MIDLKIGDCLDKMKDIEDNSVDMILTDAPYELGFMGKKWDNTGIAFNIKVWEEALRVLKPGGYLMAFSGSRTYHRMAVAIEDAGFVVKDMIEWMYGSGFPKSLDISKAIDKKLGKEREIIGSKHGKTDFSKAKKGDKSFYESAWQNKDYISIDITAPASDLAKQYEGYKSQLKPSHEPICLAQKKIEKKTIVDNVMEWGTGALNIDGTRVETNEIIEKGRNGRFNSSIFQGSKINNDPIIYHQEGRYPANLIIHENIADILDSQSGYSKSRPNIVKEKYKSSENGVNTPFKRGGDTYHNDKGGASRYFKNIEEEDTYIPFIYHAKASKKDRNIDINGEQITGEAKGAEYYLNSTHRKDGTEIKSFKNVNNHATVKPTGLMKYLLKMGLPPIKDAVVLDMFAGSGSTGVALEQLNKEEGTEHKCILIEMEEDHAEIIKKRCCLSK